MFLLVLDAPAMAGGRETPDDCAYLPDAPVPSWIHKLPDLPDLYVGVGSASRHASPEEQIQASMDAALAALAAGIQVYVKGTTIEIATVSENKEAIDISSHTESSVRQLLREARIQSRWLDRKNCILWTLASVPKLVIEAALSRRVMLFDVTPAPEAEPLSQWLRTQLEQLFRALGTATAQSEVRFISCASGDQDSACREQPNIIFAGYSLSLEKEKLSTDGMYRGRYLRLRGALHQQAKVVSSFDVTCHGTGKVSQDPGQIDQL
jgi:hypothetical protein